MKKLLLLASILFSLSSIAKPGNTLSKSIWFPDYAQSYTEDFTQKIQNKVYDLENVQIETIKNVGMAAFDCLDEAYENTIFTMKMKKKDYYCSGFFACMVNEVSVEVSNLWTKQSKVLKFRASCRMERKNYTEALESLGFDKRSEQNFIFTKNID